MRELSVEDQIYLCKYHDVDHALENTMHMTTEEVEKALNKYKENGLYEQYRNLSDEEYEKIIIQEKKDKRMKKYNQKQDIYKKEKEILDKYNFDKKKTTYNYFIELLIEAERTIKNNEEFITNKVLRSIASKTGNKIYNISNECQRYLTNTYTNNKELFFKYYKKPSLREFITNESISNIKETKTADIGKTEYKIKDIENMTEEVLPLLKVENEKDIKEAEVEIKPISQNILKKDMIVQVPLNLILQLYYLKGYIDKQEGKGISSEFNNI